MSQIYFTIGKLNFTDDNYIDNNHFYLSDSQAGKLARLKYHDGLPKHGFERKITTTDGRDCWIKRTPLSYWKGKETKRKWVWSIMGPFNK